MKDNLLSVMTAMSASESGLIVGVVVGLLVLFTREDAVGESVEGLVLKGMDVAFEDRTETEGTKGESEELGAPTANAAKKRMYKEGREDPVILGGPMQRVEK